MVHPAQRSYHSGTRGTVRPNQDAPADAQIRTRSDRCRGRLCDRPWTLFRTRAPEKLDRGLHSGSKMAFSQSIGTRSKTRRPKRIWGGGSRCSGTDFSTERASGPPIFVLCGSAEPRNCLRARTQPVLGSLIVFVVMASSSCIWMVRRRREAHEAVFPPLTPRI